MMFTSLHFVSRQFATKSAGTIGIESTHIKNLEKSLPGTLVIVADCTNDATR